MTDLPNLPDDCDILSMTFEHEVISRREERIARRAANLAYKRGYEDGLANSDSSLMTVDGAEIIDYKQNIIKKIDSIRNVPSGFDQLKHICFDLVNKIDSIKDIHKRILSSNPYELEAAYSIILQMAAMLSRLGYSGNKIVEAVDAIKMHISKMNSEIDKLMLK